MTTPQKSLTVIPATEQHRSVLEQLWTMFRHDMSAFTGALPNAHGRYRQERLDAALEDPGWAGYLLRLDQAAVGFAIVRGLDADERVISSFFLVNGLRRAGYGRAALRTITRARPGRWAVAFQDANASAAAFWRAVSSEADDDWRLEHRDVPGRADLPADTWIRFNVS